MNPRALAFCALVLLWLLGAGSSDPVRSEPAAGPVIRFNSAKATIDVLGLDRADLANLAGTSLDSSQWKALLAVYVQKGNKGESTNTPAVLGSYRVDQDAVRFEPRFPLAPG